MGVLQYTFYSKILGKQTQLYAILPEEMHQGKKPAATMYLLHGGGGDGQDWLRFTSIERYAQEHQLAVIMPEVDGNCFYADMEYGYPYFTYLTEEFPTVAERLFSLNSERKKRFVAGLSMGGYGAWKWAFNEPKAFGAAANLSGVSFITEIFQEGGFAAAEGLQKENGLVVRNWGGMEKLTGSSSDSKEWIDRAVAENTDLPALYAGIGTEDFSYSDFKNYLAYCEAQGVEVRKREIPGKHEWKVWDELIEDFIEWALVHAVN